MSTPVDDDKHLGGGAAGAANGVNGRGESAGRRANSGKARQRRQRDSHAPVYGALDLGTNNCRLLLAQPQADSFRVVDAFSRIIRLGEGVGQSGRLSDEAMARTIDALKVCNEKMTRRRVRRARLIATEACRSAENGEEFIDRVHNETGLRLEIIARETEARLAVAGCAALLDQDYRLAIVFDIGGGSSELMLVEIGAAQVPAKAAPEDQLAAATMAPPYEILAWASLPIGVVTLAELYGGNHVDRPLFARMVNHVSECLDEFAQECRPLVAAADGGPMHLLGTSGTVTTIAGVHLGLRRYDRSRVDGCWLERNQAAETTSRLLDMSFAERIQSPCIGRDRADLVLAGCAILEAIVNTWPCDRLRVADRGLREGILSQLMMADGYMSARHTNKKRRNRQAGEAGEATRSQLP